MESQDYKQYDLTNRDTSRIRFSQQGKQVIIYLPTDAHTFRISFEPRITFFQYSLNIRGECNIYKCGHMQPEEHSSLIDFCNEHFKEILRKEEPQPTT